MRIVILLLLVVTACSNSKSGQSVDNNSISDLSLSVAFKSDEANAVSAQSNDQSIPIWMGKIYISAYDYRPGKSIQMGTGNFNGYTIWESEDWSRWQIVNSARGDVADFIFKPGKPISSGKSSSDRLYDDVTPEYVKRVGSFSMDIVLVQAAMSPINQHDDVCGPWYITFGSPADFPQVDFLQPCAVNNVMVKSTLDNTFLWGRTHLFIRRDWFPVPIQLYVFSDLGSEEQCYTSSIPLSDFQIEILDSFLESERGPQGWHAGTYASQCSQRAQDPITIIPQKTDPAVVKFNQKIKFEFLQETRGGKRLPIVTNRVITSNLDLSVHVDVKPTMFVNYAAFNNSQSTSTIWIRPNSEGSPIGIGVSFKPRD